MGTAEINIVIVTRQCVRKDPSSGTVLVGVLNAEKVIIPAGEAKAFIKIFLLVAPICPQCS